MQANGKRSGISATCALTCGAVQDTALEGVVLAEEIVEVFESHKINIIITGSLDSIDFQT